MTSHILFNNIHQPLISINMQSIFITGNLASDCETLSGRDGAEFLKFTVAVNDSKSSASCGDDKPTYYSCRMKKTGAVELLKKGRFVAVGGSLKVSTNVKDERTFVNLDLWVNTLDIAPIAREG